MANPKKFYATRDFRDAGTEKEFKLGDEVTAEPGVGNYVAAGLASEDKPKSDTAPAPAPGA